MTEQSQFERVISIVATIAAILSLILAVTAYRDASKGLAEQPLPASQDSVIELSKRVSNLEGRVSDLGSKIDGLSQVTDENRAAAQLASVQGSLSDLQERFRKIEGLIVQDPSKSLEIPLLRKDLESTKESNQASIGGLRQDVERAYMILVATIVALAIAVLAPAVSNLFVKRQTEK